jgi:hypothetical protein
LIDTPPQNPETPPDPDSSAPTKPLNFPPPEPTLALQPFRFLTDHNVPDSVGDTLRRLGHDIVRLRNVMAVNTTDPVVARAAIEDNRVLLSWDRDFNQQRFKSPRFEGLSRLSMSGPEMYGATRLEAVFDVIEFALRRSAGAPITILVGVGKVQIHV